MHGGFCRSCFLARGCSICHEVNENERALQCTTPCWEARKLQGAESPRSAMRCTSCFKPQQVAPRLCEACFESRKKLEAKLGKKCHRCNTCVDLDDKSCHCTYAQCKVSMRLCRACVSTGGPICKQCSDTKNKIALDRDLPKKCPLQ